MMPPHQPDVSVIICAYTERRWAVLCAALEALRHQTLSPREVIVVIDHNPALLHRLRSTAPDVLALANTGAQGASGARNTGIAAAHGALFAFLDDDAMPAPEWLERLVALFADPLVAVVGGASLACWSAGRRPAWFPPEFDWVVGCSYRGGPSRLERIRNVWGCNMAVRRVVLARVGLFHTALGRVGTLPVGCEETELCIRIAQQLPMHRIMYQPRAVVWHQVPAERACWRYFLARSYREGCSKAQLTGMVGPADGLQVERDYALRVLPGAVLRNVRRAASGRASRAGIGQAAAIAIGSLATLAGYLRGSTRRGAGAGAAAHAGSAAWPVPEAVAG